MTRQQKIDRIVSSDIADIQQGLKGNDTMILEMVLRGEYLSFKWKPYNQLSDAEIDQEYQAREFDGEE